MIRKLPEERKKTIRVPGELSEAAGDLGNFSSLLVDVVQSFLFMMIMMLMISVDV